MISFEGSCDTSSSSFPAGSTVVAVDSLPFTKDVEDDGIIVLARVLRR